MSTGDTPAESIRTVVRVPPPLREPPGSLFCPDNPSFLFFVWLHWTLVHAAGLGSYMFLARLLEQQITSPSIVQWLSVPFVLGGPLFIAVMQGIVLRRAGIQVRAWAVCQSLAFAFGALLAFPVYAIVSLVPTTMIRGTTHVSVVLSLFIFGCGVGLFQLIWLSLKPKFIVIWWFSSGLAMIVALAVSIFVVYLMDDVAGLSSFAYPATVLFTITGTTYGAVSGWGVVHVLRRRAHKRLASNAEPQ